MVDLSTQMEETLSLVEAVAEVGHLVQNREEVRYLVQEEEAEVKEVYGVHILMEELLLLLAHRTMADLV